MVTRFPGSGRRATGTLLATALLLGACGRFDEGDRDHWSDGDPDRRIDHVVTGAADGRQEATFELLNGSDVVRVRAADLDDDLYRVATPEDAKVAPSVQVDDDVVLAGLSGTGLGGPAIVEVLLNGRVRWHIRLTGGASEETVDLTGGRVGEVEFSAGTTRAEVSLPSASETVRVVMSGGASQFLVHLAGDAPVRVSADGGAGTVTVDGARRSGVAGGTVIAPDGWTSATDRYDIEATAGVSALTVDRR